MASETCLTIEGRIPSGPAAFFVLISLRIVSISLSSGSGILKGGDVISILSFMILIDGWSL